MKRLVKSKIAKHILGVMFVVAVMFASLQMNTKTTYALTEGVDFEKIIVSNPQFDDSKCLRSLDVVIQSKKSFPNAYGKIGIHNTQSGYDFYHPPLKAPDYGQTEVWPAVETFRNADKSVVTMSTGEEFLWTDKNAHNVTVEFGKGEVDCSKDATYYIYLWTRRSDTGIYPDCLFETTLKTSNGKLFLVNDDGEQEIEQPPYQNVIAKINAIGTVENTEECKAKIDAAREAYAALTDEEKAKITAEQYKTLTDAEENYNDIKAVDEVIEKITAIGTVENTEECKAKIDAAREAYAALTDAQKAKIAEEQYKTLTDAEGNYNDIKAVDEVIAKITAIGTVENTEECKAKIDAAREAYAALTDAQKAKIAEEQYKTLTDAEETYDNLNSNGGKYEDVKPSSGSVTDITNEAGTDKAPAETNPFSVVIKNNTESQLESIMNITSAEKAQGVNVWLTVVDASATMPSADKEKINANKGDQTVGLYLDASIFKKVGTGAEEKVHELNGKIQVSMIIPESIRKSGRTYSLVRVHNGVVENLGGTYDADTYTFTFETDKFSSYAILYKDSASGGNTSGDDDNGSGSNESGSIGNGSGSTIVGNNTTGNTASQVTAPTTATSPSPKTGDMNALVLWIALAFAALLSGSAVAISKLNNN